MAETSQYINNQRKFYSLYVLQSRAIPHLADGLKSAARRVLWVARDGEKYKTATLAGRALPLHPHAPPEGAINTLAAPYGNNIPLFTGSGAFGTMLNPTAYGAARYTSVKLSQFTKDAVFRDIDLAPMMENYDGTELEPQFLLPLVPLILLNPTSGIAVGFATNILPRALDDLINFQIKVLSKQRLGTQQLVPKFTPTNTVASSVDGSMFYFEGAYESVNSTTLRITALPYNSSHEKYTEHLDKLIEKGEILDFEDNSKDVINIEIKFKRGQLSQYTQPQLMDLLKLGSRESENLTYIDFDSETVGVGSPEEVVAKFTEWRLTWYEKRYQKLLAELEHEIQQYRDILLAIKKNVGGVARTVESRAELIAYLTEIGIVNTDYIAGFAIYRFTLEEKAKTEKKLEEALAKAKLYKDLIKSEVKRRLVYIEELKEILQK